MANPQQRFTGVLAASGRGGGHKEYAQWIAEAKREDTRERRVAKAIEMLRDGVAHPC